MFDIVEVIISAILSGLAGSALSGYLYWQAQKEVTVLKHKLEEKREQKKLESLARTYLDNLFLPADTEKRKNINRPFFEIYKVAFANLVSLPVNNEIALYEPNIFQKNIDSLAYITAKYNIKEIASIAYFLSKIFELNSNLQQYKDDLTKAFMEIDYAYHAFLKYEKYRNHLKKANNILITIYNKIKEENQKTSKS